MIRKPLYLLGLALVLAGAQTSSRFALTIDHIMLGPNLVGYEPSQVRWSGDSRRVYFAWKQYAQKPDEPLDTYVVNRDGSGLRKLSEDEARSVPPFISDSAPGGRLTVYARDGDVFVTDNSTGATRQVTRTSEVESNPHFLRDGKRIYFTRGNNLYVMPLDTGGMVQLTDITSAGAAPAPGTAAATGGRGGRGESAEPANTPEPPKGTDSQEYLKKEQSDLFETIRERAARRQEDEDKRKRQNPRKPFVLQARQTVESLQLTPDEKFVTAEIHENGAARRTIVPSYVTESAYAETIPARPDVGDTPDSTRLALIAVDTGEVKWADPGIETADGKSRKIDFTQPNWCEDGSKAFVIGRALDNKDRWVFALDPLSAKLRVLADIHDDAWVNSMPPPDSHDDVWLSDLRDSTAAGWMPNSREVYFDSERSGYSQLYAVSFDGAQPRLLTPGGDWEVLGVRQSPDKSKFYLTANYDGPFENHLYEMTAAGGPLTRITQAPGKHIATVSPDGQWLADVYSYTNKPPELYLQENRPAAETRKVTNSPAPEFFDYPWQDAPIVQFTARDGAKVAARLYRPPGFPRGGPAVVFIHGAGYLQNVDRWWSGNYYREYMFQHILMDRGFLVIDVDYRGSAGYGRDWRVGIYQHMGGKDLEDIVDAAKYLAAAQGADPKKIGLYGGSYGGFLTLMGMFTQPDVFAAGAALRPVTDWAFYNQGYTSEILNLPQTDSEAYRKSSPIYFAEGLRGALLICHGMVDTNVEFQDTVRLTQRLIELHKENWQVAMYPVENHSFVEAASWADEYKRILKLFEEHLK